ncbi:MAG: FAD-dependent oxidoreductase [Thiolinea sp.]
MKSHTKVAIIGGGSLGVNLAYQLSTMGWTDIALIEKGELTSGSTWHAAGLCSNFIGNHTVAAIQDYSIRFYRDELPKLTGEPTPFHTTGSLRLGFSEVEEQWFRNLDSRMRNIGCEFHIVSREEAKQLNPLMDFSKARIIVSTPNDGHVDPTSVVMPIANLAKQNGVEINRNTRVLEINQLASGEWAVVTDQGTIHAEHVVNAAGCFSPEVGAMVGVKVPLVNLEHQYLITEPHQAIRALDRELPVCRDSWSSSYIRQEGQGFLVGPYETHGSKPWALQGMDWDFDRGLFPGDLERIMPFLERQMELTPAFAETGVKTVINGAITHTPDDNALVGPQAGLRNFWNLCGSSIGIAQGAGLGHYLAQWMTQGQTEINMAPLDSRRFGGWVDKKYCVTKAIESYEIMYQPVAPNDNRPYARMMRTSPLHAALAAKGAVFNVVAGYERPMFFGQGEVRGETPTWGHSESFPLVKEECLAVMNHAGVIDLSMSAKYEVTGADATTFLDQLSCNKLPASDGRLGLTLFHAPNGGIMCEFSITRINAEHYYLVSAIGSEIKDLDWMQKHAAGFDVEIHNITDDWGAMLLTGPKSRDILQALTQDDISNAAFPWLTAQTIKVDSADVRVIRVSYVGELGYELHMPAYQLLSIYESLFRVGAEHGLRDFGGYAMGSMRMEKAYRAYGHEFTEEMSALEAGMERFVDLSRDFIGAGSLRERAANKADWTLNLAYLVFDDDVPCEVFGNEAVYQGEELVGIITGGAFGHRVGKSLAFAYLYRPELVEQGRKYTVLTSLGERRVRVAGDGVYDPDNRKLRG